MPDCSDRPHVSVPCGYRMTCSKQVALEHVNSISHVLLSDKRVYWARQRTVDVIKQQIESSWKFVLVLDARHDDDDLANHVDKVAGFARVIADGETFGYLADVVVSQQHEGKGLARAIVTEAVNHAGHSNNSSLDWKWLLFTDVHELYRKVLDFKDPSQRGWAMLRWPTEPPRQRLIESKIPSTYQICTDRETVQQHFDSIVEILLNHPKVYWGKARTRDMLQRQFLQQCQVVTVIHSKVDSDGQTRTRELIGFARVVTDMIDFGYIADVFVLPEHGGKGLATAMMQTTIQDLGGIGQSNNWKWTLFTDDAHKLYERFGFEKVEAQSRVMERFPRTGA
ncbi:hypothetical protein OIO90_006330 [Microbotryomycetes sp. JL221]|nr:hypothetical protein OIO90_006330 [Microbotryomycetes sp. JL221]